MSTAGCSICGCGCTEPLKPPSIYAGQLKDAKARAESITVDMTTGKLSWLECGPEGQAAVLRIEW